MKQSFEEVLSDECAVQDHAAGDQCEGELTTALAMVVVAASSAEVAGKYSQDMRKKELRRLRQALWDLRVKLESYASACSCCSITVRENLETLRSASLAPGVITQ